MAVEDDNVALLQDLYANFIKSRGDPETVLRHLDEDVLWQSLSGGAPGMDFSHEARGIDGVRRYFDVLLGDWTWQQYEVLDFIAQRDKVVCLARCVWSNQRTGKTVDTPIVAIVKLRDGKVTEYTEYYDTARAEDAARD